MGYLFLIVLIVLVVGVLVAASARMGKRPSSGTLSDRPVVREKPSADEATPGASSTASPEQAEQARRRTPPA